MSPNLKQRVLRAIGHQHWIRRGRDKLIRLLDSPDGHRSVPFEVDFFGLRYAGDLNSYVDWSVYYYGSCAGNELALLGDLARSLRAQGATRIVAVDIGANVGHHTLFLATIADVVYSFEPYPPVLEKLKEKVALNRLGHVSVQPYGLGQSDAVLDFFEPETENHGVGSFVARPRGARGLKLRIRRGDDALEELGVPKIDLLKVDVEGFEHQVFAGLASRLRADRPFVLSELSGANQAALPDKRDFEALFPPNYEFAGVGTKSVSGPYRLEPFRYGTTWEFLAYPAEKRALVAGL